MWKDLWFIIFLFFLVLVLAVYDKYSGAFFLPPGPPQVLGEASSSAQIDNSNQNNAQY